MMSTSEFPPQRVDRKTPSPRARFQYPWVPFPEGKAVLKELSSLLHLPDEGRPRCLALMAESGYGKSHLLDFFCDSYPDIDEYDFPRIQVLYVELPPEADSARMLRETLTAMGCDFKRNDPPDEMLRKAVIQIKSLRVKCVVFDEFHNALGGRRDKTNGVVQTLRALSNRCGRPIVIAGTSKVKEVLRFDAQLYERFGKWTLPKWSDLDELRKILAGFELSMELPQGTNLGTIKMGSLILELTEGYPSRVANLLRESKRVAIAHGTTITDIILKECSQRVVGTLKDGVPSVIA